MMMAPMGGAPLMMQQPVNLGGGIVYGYPPQPQMMYAPQQPVVASQIMHPQQQQHPQQLRRPVQDQGNEIPASSIGQINEKDLQALKETCPSLDDDIIRSVYQQSGGNLDRAAAQLIEMSSS